MKSNLLRFRIIYGTLNVRYRSSFIGTIDECRVVLSFLQQQGYSMIYCYRFNKRFDCFQIVDNLTLNFA